MKSCSLLLAMLVVAALCTFAQADAFDEARENLAYSTGVQAYVWGYAPWKMEQVRKRMTATTEPDAPSGRTPMNRFIFASRLLGTKFKTIPSPNNDTFYSAFWLDVGKEPMVLGLPAIKDRYFSFQFINAYTDNFHYISSRATGPIAKKAYAVCGPGWSGSLPKGIERINAPTPFVLILGRILVDGPQDVAAVTALQRQLSLVPLSRHNTDDHPDSVPLEAFKKYSGELAFLEELGDIIMKNRPLPRDAALVDQFKRIGLTPDHGFEPNTLDAPTLRGLRRALTDGHAIVEQSAQHLGRVKDGWTLSPIADNKYGTNYLLRASTALPWLFINDANEAYYPTAYVDGDDQSLDGSRHDYVLHFPKGGLPPVDAFWSVSMYRFVDKQLCDNPIDRYNIGDRTPDLEYGDDGSLILYIQHKSPGQDKQSNWLPAPSERFYVGLRLYVPKAPILNGQWTPPSIKKIR